MALPENLEALHAKEEQIRELSLHAISESHELTAHVAAIHEALDLLTLFGRLEFARDSKEQPLQLIALRLLNNASSVLKLGLSGYYQTATHLLRDKLELVNLLDLFSVEPDKLEIWRSADEETIRRQFGASKVRLAIERHAQFAGQRRDGLYRVFSVYAAHPTYQGFRLISPGGAPQLGCFFSEALLGAVLIEEARHLSHATLGLSDLFEGLSHEVEVAQIRFVDGLRAYFEKHMRPYRASDGAEEG